MHPLLRRWALALGVLAGLVLMTGTASAGVPGIVRADSNPTSLDTFSVKTATAQCLPGKQVVGAGGEISGGLGEVTMTRLEPDPGLSRVTVRAEELDGLSARNWQVEAYAMCATPIPGSHLVKAERFSAGSPDTSVTATCPAGEKVLGTGGGISNQSGVGSVVLSGLSYESSAIAKVRAQETPVGTASNWRVEALTICAPPLPGQVLGGKFSVSDSLDKSRGIGCPVGKNLLGGGAAVSFGNGEVVLDDLTPTPTGFTTFGREDASGSGANWFLQAQAICA
jgi:hypothetical protein